MTEQARQGPKDPVWEAALDWLLRVQEHPYDPALQQELACWLQGSEAHLRAYRKAEKVWLLSGQLANVAGFDCPLPAPAPRPATRYRRLRRVLAGGAVAASAALLALPDWQGINADYRSPTGEHRRVTLADGSVVDLDSGSAIDVDFTVDKRRVTLLRGQAFFAVASHPGRAFEVTAEAITVTVTGTAFAVEVSPKSVDVSVAHGSVRVADKRQRGDALAPLAPGQGVRFQREGQGVQRLRIPVEQIAAWRNWQLLAVDQPLSEIVARLDQYQPGMIVLNDEALGKRTLTAALDLRSVRHALQAAVAPLGGQVRELSPYVLWVSGG